MRRQGSIDGANETVHVAVEIAAGRDFRRVEKGKIAEIRRQVGAVRYFGAVECLFEDFLFAHCLFAHCLFAHCLFAYCLFEHCLFEHCLFEHCLFEH